MDTGIVTRGLVHRLSVVVTVYKMCNEPCASLAAALLTNTRGNGWQMCIANLYDLGFRSQLRFAHSSSIDLLVLYIS